MNKFFKKSMLSLLIAGIAVCFIFSATYAQEAIVSKPAEILKTGKEVVAYWTPERLAKATPYPLPAAEASEDGITGQPEAEPLGPPGVVYGTLPGSEYQPSEMLVDDEPQNWGGPPGNWSSSYPGPFQRWTWFGRYLTYPTSTIGKMFFTQDGINYVCSASVVYAGGPQHDVVATAGHCVHRGSPGGTNNGWSYNVLFCPSYNRRGVNPAAGCWPEVNLASFTAWTQRGEIEADVGCIITRNTGTIVGTNVGNFTGTLGRAWNFGADEPEFSAGYPAASPFPGYHIIYVAGPEWYTYNWGGTDFDGSPLADSKYMGNDMTGGSSGGPWLLNLEHRNFAYPDTDSNDFTDPGAGFTTPFLNGVNSHKIISGGVLRTQEMGSAQFTTSHPDTEALWGACQSIANGS